MHAPIGTPISRRLRVLFGHGRHSFAHVWRHRQVSRSIVVMHVLAELSHQLVLHLFAEVVLVTELLGDFRDVFVFVDRNITGFLISHGYLDTQDRFGRLLGRHRSPCKRDVFQFRRRLLGANG